MSLYKTLRDIEDSAKVKCVTCEFEILLCLYYHPHISAGELFKHSRYSSTTFYATLKRLTQNGLLTVTTDHQDKRSNVYCLGSEIIGIVKGCLCEMGVG